MRRKYMGLAIMMTALLLGGCASTASGTDETTTAAQTTVEETSSAAETTTEAAFAEESSEETTEGAADTGTKDSGYTEEAQDAFLALMDDCADVAPGTAGTSLRTAAAAAGLLDWEEEQADSSLSEDDIKDLMAAWKEARTENDWAYLQESWSQVAVSMREIAADPEGQAELVEDAGYTLEHTSYQTDVMEMVIGAIEETLSE